MSWRRPATIPNGLTHTLGIALLFLGLVHTPLPQPDFHKIRHQDGLGEVCEHHDHLLRWHPEAAGAGEAAVLHWHWFLPGPPGADTSHEGNGLAVHAHLPAWDASAWDDGPRLVASDTASRPAARPAPCPVDDLPLIVPGPALLGSAPACGRHPASTFGATFAPGVSPNARLQRWDC